MNACIITIGDELLIGQVVDTNSAWMGTELNKAGVDVKRKIAVGDEKEEIIEALNEAKEKADVILITGGLGPTKDDLTKNILCEYFGGKLVMNEEVLEMVEAIFKKFKRPMIERNREQALVPDNCIVIKNFQGTAPGMMWERDQKIFVSMPGVPYEMKAMMTDSVLPMLKKRSKLIVIHETIHTQGLGESFIAEKIKDIEESFPANLKLAYLPHYSTVRLRLTAKGNDEAGLKKIISDFRQKIESQISEYVFGHDDTSLEKVIGEALRQQNKTMATAESCTGGLIAQKIVSIAGASDYFKGSIVCYDNEIKEKILGVKAETLNSFGAVSEECVKEMVNGLLKVTNANYGIAVSGIAGPSGGTPEKPVGTVWIAVANSTETITRNFSFPGNRERVMELSAINALGMLLKFAKAVKTL